MMRKGFTAIEKSALIWNPQGPSRKKTEKEMALNTFGRS